MLRAALQAATRIKVDRYSTIAGFVRLNAANGIATFRRAVLPINVGNAVALPLDATVGFPGELCRAVNLDKGDKCSILLHIGKARQAVTFDAGFGTVDYVRLGDATDVAPVQHVVPRTTPPNAATFAVADLAAALNRLPSERFGAIYRADFGGESLQLSSEGVQSARTACPYEYTGEAAVVGVNEKYLKSALDAVKRLGNTSVTWRFTDRRSVFVLEAGALTYLIMPFRLPDAAEEPDEEEDVTDDEAVEVAS